VDLSDIQSPFGDYLTSVAEARAHPDKDVKKILTNGANPDPGDISAEGQINIDALAEFRRADDEVILLVRFSNISLANTSPMATRAHLGLPKWRLKRVQTYIETHMEEQITTAALAGAVGLSPTYFAGQFKTSTGLCPHDYVTRKRIETAQRLLLDPNLKIIEIAIGVGFQTQAHFTTSFKKIVGMTPWKWRRDNYAGV
jgi:AraC-like DNA-binding protein